MTESKTLGAPLVPSVPTHPVGQGWFPTPQDMALMRELGSTLVKSGFLPVSIKTPEQAVVILLKGRELGLPPMQAFSSITVIQGKPAISAEGMMALIRQRIPHAQISFIETSNEKCVIEARRGPKERASTITFTLDDAKRADLVGKGVWKQYPAAMLRARCISAMARMIFPDALMGTSYTPEELGSDAIDVDSEPVNHNTQEPGQDPKTPAAVPPEIAMGKTVVKLPVPDPALTARRQHIVTLMKQHALTPAFIGDWLKEKYKVKNLDELTEPNYQELCSDIVNASWSSPPDGFFQELDLPSTGVPERE